MTDQPTRPYRRRFATIALGCVVGVAAGLAAVYGIGAMQRNPADASCKAAAELAKQLPPPARRGGDASRDAGRAKRPPPPNLSRSRRQPPPPFDIHVKTLP